MSGKNIFQRIIDQEVPAKVVYEDEFCLAFPSGTSSRWMTPAWTTKWSSGT
jgi:diadenosine tetraphosphate (Ap4A) HIT family hydrolase